MTATKEICLPPYWQMATNNPHPLPLHIALANCIFSYSLFPRKTSKASYNNSEYRKIPKVSPRGYIFKRPFLRGLFLEGLIFGGAEIRREICVSNSARLLLEGKFTSQNRLGYLIVYRKFMSVICTKFLLKLALTT